MRKNIYTVLLLSLFTFHQSLAQSVRLSRGPDVAISKSVKKQLMSRLGERIEENYYDREGVEPLINLLEELRKSGDYKKQDQSQAFARYLTLTLRDFTNDPHFNVIYSPSMFEQARSFEQNATGPSQRTPVADPQNDPDRQTNFFMPKLEVLEGNVGYFQIEQMANIVNARETVDAAMQFLAHTDALILDLRGNRGGIGGFTPYMASFFFPDAKKLLFSREFPAYDSASHFYTAEELGAPRYEEPELYVLIDGITGSAARNLAYTLQQHGRARLVGEETGVGTAGGHSAGLFALNEGFIATVPIANVVHPVSNSNWSMVGVIPDRETSSENALKEGHLLALTTLWNRAEGDQKAELAKLMDQLKLPQNKEESTTAKDFTAYTGAYEQRKVFVENNKLYLQRQGGPKLELKWIEKDLFQLTLPPNSRSATVLPKVRFEREEGNTVKGLSFIRPDGSIEGTAKKLD